MVVILKTKAINVNGKRVVINEKDFDSTKHVPWLDITEDGGAGGGSGKPVDLDFEPEPSEEQLPPADNELKEGEPLPGDYVPEDPKPVAKPAAKAKPKLKRKRAPK